MAPGVREIASSLTLGNLSEIRACYQISESTAMMVPEAQDRALYPPDGFITVYEVHLKGRLRFPVSEELYEIMRALVVPFARLQPNAIRYLVSLCVFLRCHQKLLNVTTVKVMFRFTHNLDWIIMTHRLDFSLMCGENPDSTKRWKDKFFFLGVHEHWAIPGGWGKVASQWCSEPSLEEKEIAKEFTDLVLANLGGFHLDKRNIWLSPEKFQEAKWGSQAETSAAAPSKRSKKKRSRGSTRPLRIGSPAGLPEGRATTESSKRPAALVEYPPSEDDDDDDDDVFDVVVGDLSDQDVIAPLLKRPRRTAIQISERPDVQPPGDDISVVPAGSPRGVSDRIDHPSEDIGGGDSFRAETVREASVPEDFIIELLSPDPDAHPVEVQADTGEAREGSYDEEVGDAQDSHASEEGTVAPFIAVEPLATASRAGPSLPEAKVVVSVAPVLEPQAPETTGEASVSGDSLISQLRDVAGKIDVIIGGVAQGFSQMEALKTVGEARNKIALLEESAKLQRAQQLMLQERLYILEERLRASISPAELGPLLESRFWDGIHMCRRVIRLIHSRFPAAVLDPRNANALTAEDLYGISGRPFPSSSEPGPSVPFDPAEPPALHEDQPHQAKFSGSQPPES